MLMCQFCSKHQLLFVQLEIKKVCISHFTQFNNICEVQFSYKLCNFCCCLFLNLIYKYLYILKNTQNLSCHHVGLIGCYHHNPPSNQFHSCPINNQYLQCHTTEILPDEEVFSVNTTEGPDFARSADSAVSMNIPGCSLQSPVLSSSHRHGNGCSQITLKS